MSKFLSVIEKNFVEVKEETVVESIHLTKGNEPFDESTKEDATRCDKDGWRKKKGDGEC